MTCMSSSAQVSGLKAYTIRSKSIFPSYYSLRKANLWLSMCKAYVQAPMCKDFCYVRAYVQGIRSMHQACCKIVVKNDTW